MMKRLLCLGLLAAGTQLFGTGCLFHPVARFRANHPCGVCAPIRPVLHPIHTRRAILADAYGPDVGPVVGSPPCHGCSASGAAPGVPVGYDSGYSGVVPVTGATGGYPPIGYPAIGYPAIGSPMPITGGPTVVPSYELPSPMPVKPPEKDK